MSEFQGPYSKADIKAGLARMEEWKWSSYDALGAGASLADRQQFLEERAAQSGYSQDPFLVRSEVAAPVFITPIVEQREKIGAEPLSGEEVTVSGHISSDTLWLVDQTGDRIQEMRRYVVASEGDLDNPRIVDVYSEPAKPVVIETQSGRHLNTDAIRESGAHTLINNLNGGDTVIGWLQIPEVIQKQIPTYEE